MDLAEEVGECGGRVDGVDQRCSCRLGAGEERGDRPGPRKEVSWRAGVGWGRDWQVNLGCQQGKPGLFILDQASCDLPVGDSDGGDVT